MRQTALDEDEVQTTLEDGTLEQMSAEKRARLAYARLRDRYNRGDGWFLFEEVGAPHAEGGRRVDAIAVSAWNSRGYEVHGFEIKASRSDWLSELDDPGKAGWWMQRVDRWWLVAPTHVADEDELPKNWGWLRLNNGGNLRRAVSAPRLEANVDRKLLGRLVKRLDDAWDERPKEQALEEQYDEGYEKGVRAGKRQASDRQMQRLERKVERYEERLDRFEELTGLSLKRDYSWEENVMKAADAIKAVVLMREKEEQAKREIAAAHKHLVRQLEDLEELMEDLPGEVDEESLRMLGAG